MHPVLTAEIQQTRQHFWKALLLMGGLCLLLRLTMGSFGVLIGFIIVVPNFATATGLGTFAEEFTKGQFRFLYALPVSARSIWIIKLISGIVGTLEFAAVAAAVYFIAPGPEVDAALEKLQLFGLSVGKIFALGGALSLYGFSSGMLAITMCSSTRTAAIANVLVMYLPLGAAFGSYGAVDAVPSLPMLLVMFLVPSGILLAGSYVLFAARNPFDERRWRLRGIGGGFMLLTGFSVLVLAVVATLLAEVGLQPHFDRVMGMSLSPDRKRIFVVTGSRPDRTHGCVISSNGTVLHDFGRDVLGWDSDPLTWVPPDHRRVAYQRLPAPRSALAALDEFEELDEYAGFPNQSALVVHDLDQDTRWEVPAPAGVEPTGWRQYRAWSSDGSHLLGTGYVGMVGFAFRLNVSTGAYEETQLYSEDSAFMSPLSDSLVRIDPMSEDRSAARVIELYDLERGSRRRIDLPEGTKQITFDHTGNCAVVARRIVDSDSVGFEVLQVSVDGDSPSRVLLERSRLPTSSLEAAVDGSIGFVGLESVAGANWVSCIAVTAEEERTQWLIDLDGDRLISVKDRPAMWQIQMSPFGERAVFFEQDEEDRIPGDTEIDYVIVEFTPAGPIETHRMKSPILRKEVIQPQVPLRLPCYDLVPVTELAVGAASLRLAKRLRALPASMT
jgi:hypothetical protein